MKGGCIYVGYDLYSDRKSESSESGAFESQRRTLAGYVAWYQRAKDGKWLHLSDTDMQVSRQKMMGGSSDTGSQGGSRRGGGPVVEERPMRTLQDFIDEVFKILVKDEPVGRMVVYRDGVGDSMMDKVRVEEMAALETYLAGRVKMTFMVVQTRVHDRYTTAHTKGPVVEWHNIPRGHVVEHSESCFSCIAVDCTLATSKPVKYFIMNDGGLEAKAIQTLTYALCWMYSNWPGSIKVPFVLQCAHKLAFFHGTSSAAKPNVQLSLRQMPYYL